MATQVSFSQKQKHFLTNLNLIHTQISFQRLNAESITEILKKCWLKSQTAIKNTISNIMGTRGHDSPYFRDTRKTTALIRELQTLLESSSEEVFIN